MGIETTKTIATITLGQAAQKLGISLSENRQPVPIEIQMNGFVRGFSPIHFTVQAKA